MAAIDKERSSTDTETNQTIITISFSVSNKIGELSKALEKLAKHKVNIHHINSKPHKERNEDVDFIVICDNTGCLKKAIKELKDVSKNVEILSVPWFPKHASDLDKVAPRALTCEKELKADHPGFQDAEYKKRRTEVAAMSRDYKHYQEIPTVEYTEDEIKTWGSIYTSLVALHKRHACERYIRNFERLKNECGFSSGKIPQLEDVSKFLQSCTGFRLRPAPGLISIRDFLAALAFRTFYSTQYIRHNSKPEYTPEPDICHELLGHVPLFADKEFAQFAQEIGLASLGAPNDYITWLSRLYWYTVEVGLWKEEGEIKVYGAALLSSAKELEHCTKDDARKEKFTAAAAKEVKVQFSKLQPYYFVAESFEDVKKEIREFDKENNPRPFDVELTQCGSVEVIYR